MQTGATTTPNASCGTGGSNPVPSTGESRANRTFRGGRFHAASLKMQGVVDVLQNALVVRRKFTATPSRPTYLQPPGIAPAN
jgi:hypothetical protein